MTPLYANARPAQGGPVTLFSVHRNAGLAHRNNTASQCRMTGGKGPLRQVAVANRKGGPAQQHCKTTLQNEKWDSRGKKDLIHGR